jgi:excisionase family DNA binding protein
MNENNEYYTIIQIAEMLNRSRQTVNRWFLLGKVEGAYRVGSEWRLNSNDYDRQFGEKGGSDD